MPDCITRRRVLGIGAAGGALLLGALGRAASAQPAAWNPGPLAHLVPAASHERFLIKASLRSPTSAPLSLMIDDRMVQGVMADAAGRFWWFDIPGLRPATTYELRLVVGPGDPLTDSWPLRTFHAPDAKVERLRILAFTCAGGYDGPPLNGKTFFLDMAARRRLLARGLSYAPDVVIANGDDVGVLIPEDLGSPQDEDEGADGIHQIIVGCLLARVPGPEITLNAAAKLLAWSGDERFAKYRQTNPKGHQRANESLRRAILTACRRNICMISDGRSRGFTCNEHSSPVTLRRFDHPASAVDLASQPTEFEEDA